MKAYIDDFNLIRIEGLEPIKYVAMKNNKVRLKRINKTTVLGYLKNELVLNIENIVYVNDYKLVLEIGLVTQTSNFNQKYQYDGPLGAIYKKEETSFYVFSPTAQDLKVVLDGTEYEMIYRNGVWEATVKGNHHLKAYYYLVKNKSFYKKALDPYAKAGTNDFSYVIDFSKTKQISKSSITQTNYLDTIIYEGHVRDLTHNLKLDNKNLYLGLIEKSEFLGMSVLDYIKSLGVTHLQLLPIYDFGGVNDINKDELYNWGYNPEQYFLLDGWYSKDPNNPIARINEVKEVVEYAHNIGLGINMDVVYNHVYEAKKFSYDILVPNYFYRFSNQKMTNTSGCGSDNETKNYMVRRLIVDSLIFFVEEYKIDGFRFDLMGLMDIQTMLLIEKELKKRNPKIMLYGEGWNMPSAISEKERPNMSNQKLIKGYAQFNDQFRNVLKGTDNGGYAMGANNDFQIVKWSILGSPNLFDSPLQSINYVECHDNHTFYDKLTISTNYSDSVKMEYSDFALHLVIISQGIPFIHAGQEFYRSKNGVENSYKSNDSINAIKWGPRLTSVDKLKKLIKIRKEHPVYHQKYYLENGEVKEVNSLIEYVLKNGEYTLTHYLKNDHKTNILDLEGKRLIFASHDFLLAGVDKIKINKPGVYIVKENKKS